MQRNALVLQQESNCPVSDEVQLVTRVCQKCKMELPLNAMTFDRDKGDALGFKRICKTCRSTEAKRDLAKGIDEKLKKFDNIALGLLDRAIDPESGTSASHVAELWANVLRGVGGAHGLGGHLVSHLLATPLGSPERTRVLSMMLKLGQAVTESGVATVPNELLSNEELNEKLSREIASIVKQRELQKSYDDLHKPKIEQPAEPDDQDSTEGIGGGE